MDNQFLRLFVARPRFLTLGDIQRSYRALGNLMTTVCFLLGIFTAQVDVLCGLDLSQPAAAWFGVGPLGLQTRAEGARPIRRATLSAKAGMSR
jgi:hypothetical protein